MQEPIHSEIDGIITYKKMAAKFGLKSVRGKWIMQEKIIRPVFGIRILALIPIPNVILPGDKRNEFIYTLYCHV